MSDAIAVLNAGSSSLKFSLFAERGNALELTVRGQTVSLEEMRKFVPTLFSPVSFPCHGIRGAHMSNVAAYLAKEALKDGNEVTIRAMHPDDKERLVKAFLHLQPQTIRMRFFYAKRDLSEGDLRWLDKISRGNHVGLVAAVPSGRDELIIGEGSYAALGHTAEIGFTVADAWQGRGIASRLLQHLARIARDQGVGQFEAYVLKDNAPMLAVFRHSGLPMTTRDAEGMLHVTLLLDSPAAPR